MDSVEIGVISSACANSTHAIIYVPSHSFPISVEFIQITCCQDRRISLLCDVIMAINILHHIYISKFPQITCPVFIVPYAIYHSFNVEFVWKYF